MKSLFFEFLLLTAAVHAATPAESNDEPGLLSRLKNKVKSGVSSIKESVGSATSNLFMDKVMKDEIFPTAKPDEFFSFKGDMWDIDQFPDGIDMSGEVPSEVFEESGAVSGLDRRKLPGFKLKLMPDWFTQMGNLLFDLMFSNSGWQKLQAYVLPQQQTTVISTPGIFNISEAKILHVENPKISSLELKEDGIHLDIKNVNIRATVKFYLKYGMSTRGSILITCDDAGFSTIIAPFIKVSADQNDRQLVINVTKSDLDLSSCVLTVQESSYSAVFNQITFWLRSYIQKKGEQSVNSYLTKELPPYLAKYAPTLMSSVLQTVDTMTQTYYAANFDLSNNFGFEEPRIKIHADYFSIASDFRLDVFADASGSIIPEKERDYNFGPKTAKLPSVSASGAEDAPMSQDQKKPGAFKKFGKKLKKLF